METKTKTFLVDVKMSCLLHTLNGIQIEMPYTGIIPANSKEDCLEELLKKIEEIIKEAVQKKIEPSLSEIRVNELGEFKPGELVAEIIFSWQRKVGYLPYLDPYKLLEYLEKNHEGFLKQHGIDPSYHNDLPFT